MNFSIDLLSKKAIHAEALTDVNLKLLMKFYVGFCRVEFLHVSLSNVV